MKSESRCQSLSLDIKDQNGQRKNILYPSLSEGIYSRNLVDFLSRLVHSFCSRLRKERYNDHKDNRPHWIPKYNVTLYITDEQVDIFCNMVHPVIMDLTMSKR